MRGSVAHGSCVKTQCFHKLERPLRWSKKELDASNLPPSILATLRPPWKIILLSDGSVTRHLQLMSGIPAEVECLEMRALSRLESQPESGLIHPTAHALSGQLVQRQVLLHLSDRAYVYAASWWEADTVDSYLKDKDKPIWVSLSQERTELYREIQDLEHGASSFLDRKFKAQGPYFARSYLFYHRGRPLAAIYEVFSTALTEFLGPMFVDKS